jgi:hypothetical protein
MAKNEILPIVKDGNNEEKIEISFDPNDIRISNQSLDIGQIINRLEHNEIELNANFEPIQEIWNTDKMSLLIESILLRLPIPAFYFDAQNYNKWEIIDGLQRIRTLKYFIIDNSFRLQNLQFLKDLNGKTYRDLPRAMQRNMASFPITAVIIDKGTPLMIKYHLFCRLNNRNIGRGLKAQEIRSIVFKGKVIDLINKLATSDAFKLATNWGIKTERMEDKNLVSRFLAFWLIPYFAYTPNLNTFINKGLEMLKGLDNVFFEKTENTFLQSMSLAYNIFGDDAFRKRLNIADKKKPINKALFECLSVCFANLSNDESSVLLAKKELFKTFFIELNNNLLFGAAITQNTSKKENVMYRFHFIKNIINQTLKNA